jgi:hypothetical protein
MKTKIITIIMMLLLGFVTNCFSQYTTGNHGIGGGTIRIDTNSTTVTLTIIGPSTKWLGIGFGSNATSMATCTDMFIWNDSPYRDYTLDAVTNGGHNMPVPDADQSWTIVSDTVASGIRTVVATRALVSAGDYTFLNNSSYLQFIVAQGDTPTLAYHGTSNLHSTVAMSRWVLALEDFSIDAPSLYPNPAKSNFTIKTKTTIDKIIIYSQTGAVVKTINIATPKDENEVMVSDLAKGSYVVELHNGSEKMYKNLMVE